jgi:hypothetical protein
LRQVCATRLYVACVTETGGQRRSLDLQEETIALRRVATAERRPIGSTDKTVRGVACTIRNTQVPVHPGCGIRQVLITMPGSLRGRGAAHSEKLKFRSGDFFAGSWRA